MARKKWFYSFMKRPICIFTENTSMTRVKGFNKEAACHIFNILQEISRINRTDTIIFNVDKSGFSIV